PVSRVGEVDKSGADFRGEPASALLEVLDPEQNNTFKDHYIDLPFDLSEVLFITTADVLDTVPPALRDRMEVIRLAGYIEEEKLHIARRHLIPRQLENHGVTAEIVASGDEALRQLIREYTREAGLRHLERVTARVSRSLARQLGIEDSFFERVDLHLHVPEGAIPKDGPSAGITLVTSIVSLLTGRPVRPRVAMTGEMTLSGRVLPVGGIKEKVLAAHRMGVKEVILPKRNEKAVKEDIPENVQSDLKIHLVSSIEEVLELALTPGEPYEAMRDRSRWQLRLSN